MKNFGESLGPPDISLAGLQLWIHGRQFPEAEDFWDGNWLNVTAHCGGEGADVWTSGAILHASDLARWLEELEELNLKLHGGAKLVGPETALRIELEAGALGQLALRVEITPNQMTQRHEFNFELDQTYLKPLLEDCRRAMSRHPVRDARKV